MDKQSLRDTFEPRHHALLFAWISREAVSRLGAERGGEIMLAAVRQYGRQRGRRMALRVQADGRELSPLNYLCYGEWLPNKEEMEIKIVDRKPEARYRVFKCPWESIWKKHNLLEFGKYYCMAADEAIFEGYNPHMNIELNGTRTTGAPYCEFQAHDLTLTLGNILRLLIRKKRVSQKASMPWDYHTGHLFKTVSETVHSQAGPEGEAIMQAALAEFAGFFGEDAVRIVEGFRDTDFDRLPDSDQDIP